MSKLTKYLESKTKGIAHNDSGSSYYTFGKRKIRVSDHLPPIQKSEDLQILISGNSGTIYIASVFGKVFTFVGFSNIRNFIDHWLIIVGQKDNQSERLVDTRISDLQDKVLALNTRVMKAEQSALIKLPSIQIKNGVIPINKFSLAQQKVISNFAKQIKI